VRQVSGTGEHHAGGGLSFERLIVDLVMLALTGGVIAWGVAAA